MLELDDLEDDEEMGWDELSVIALQKQTMSGGFAGRFGPVSLKGK